jgi:hypothetical protein
MHATAADEGAPTATRKSGDRLYAKKHDASWLAVKAEDGTQGFMATSCFR